MTKPNLTNGKLKLSILFLLISGFGALAQTEIEADFSQDSYPPLIKTKFNVYQTPLAPQQRWERDMPLLKELQIRALRFETAWEKALTSTPRTLPENIRILITTDKFILNLWSR